MKLSMKRWLRARTTRQRGGMSIDIGCATITHRWISHNLERNFFSPVEQRHCEWKAAEMAVSAGNTPVSELSSRGATQQA
jgi:hypothetical protein